MVQAAAADAEKFAGIGVGAGVGAALVGAALFAVFTGRLARFGIGKRYGRPAGDAAPLLGGVGPGGPGGGGAAGGGAGGPSEEDSLIKFRTKRAGKRDSTVGARLMALEAGHEVDTAGLGVGAGAGSGTDGGAGEAAAASSTSPADAASSNANAGDEDNDGSGSSGGGARGYQPPSLSSRKGASGRGAALLTLLSLSLSVASTSAAPGDVLWSFLTQGWVTASPVASPDGSQVFAVSQDGNLYSIDVATGKMYWYAEIGQELTAVSVPPSGSQVLVGAANGFVYDYSPLGSALWSVNVKSSTSPTPILGPITFSPDGLYAYVGLSSYGGGKGAVAGINMVTNALAFQDVLVESSSFAPVVGSNGTIYVGLSDGSVVELNSTGPSTPSWTYDGPAPAGPLAISGQIVFAGAEGQVAALFTKSGAPIWTAPMPAGAMAFPTVSPNGTLLFVSSESGSVTALKAIDGSPAWAAPWQAPNGFAVRSAPVLYSSPSGLGLLVAADDGCIHALSSEDGSEMWVGCSGTGGHIFSSPALSLDGRAAYFGSLDSRVYAIQLV